VTPEATEPFSIFKMLANIANVTGYIISGLEGGFNSLFPYIKNLKLKKVGDYFAVEGLSPGVVPGIGARFKLVDSNKFPKVAELGDLKFFSNAFNFFGTAFDFLNAAFKYHDNFSGDGTFAQESSGFAVDLGVDFVIGAAAKWLALVLAPVVGTLVVGAAAAVGVVISANAAVIGSAVVVAVATGFALERVFENEIIGDQSLSDFAKLGGEWVMKHAIEGWSIILGKEVAESADALSFYALSAATSAVEAVGDFFGDMWDWALGV
jgi:hypothetical protein